MPRVHDIPPKREPAARRRPSGSRSARVTRRIAHRWTDLFDLVLDMERFPRFVPHCRAVRIYSRKTDERGRSVVVSRMTVGYSALEIGYVNRTTADRAARRIEVEATEGPLRHLQVLWTFEPDGDATQVGFAVDYAFGSALLSALAARLFDAMFADILTAFERRADSLFGRAAGVVAVASPVLPVAPSGLAGDAAP